MSSKRFRVIREDLELTQGEASEILGLSDKTIVSRLESGKRSPGTLTMAVMEVLNELPRKESLKIMELLKKHVAKIQRGSGH